MNMFYLQCYFSSVAVGKSHISYFITSEIGIKNMYSAHSYNLYAVYDKSIGSNI